MISEKILEFAKMGRARVAIGLIKSNAEIIASLHNAKEYSDIIVVGHSIEGFECIANKVEACHVLVQMLVEKKVDAIVRGNLNAGDTMRVLAEMFGVRKVLRAACIKDLKGREFLLVPAAMEEGNSIGERLWMVEKSVEFLKKLKCEINVGILALDEVRGAHDPSNQSIDEAEYIVSKLKQVGINAGFAGYAPEVAVEKFNIVVSPNGMIGNYIWRSIIGFGGGIDIGDFAFISEVFVDDSQYWNNYLQPIIFAVAMANMKRT